MIADLGLALGNKIQKIFRRGISSVSTALTAPIAHPVLTLPVILYWQDAQVRLTCGAKVALEAEPLGVSPVARCLRFIWLLLRCSQCIFMIICACAACCGHQHRCESDGPDPTLAPASCFHYLAVSLFLRCFTLCSHKTLRTKKLLAVNRRRNRPLPQWTRLKTGSTIRYNAKRKNWRRTKLGI